MLVLLSFIFQYCILFFVLWVKFFLVSLLTFGVKEVNQVELVLLKYYWDV